ncbi:alpha-1,2-mannosidase, putative, partial [Micrococcales bacterium KH10]
MESTPWYTSFDEIANPAGLLNSSQYNENGAETTNFSGTNFSAGSLSPLVSTISATHENTGSGEGAVNLIDGNPLTKWFAGSRSPNVDMQFDTAQRATRYILTTANDAPGRNPKNWTLRASNDGSNWTTIDTRRDQMWGNNGAPSLHTRHAFTVPTTAQGDYRHYRLDISDNNGASEGVQLSGFELIGSGTSTPNVTPWQTAIDAGPWSSRVAKAGVGFTGTKALRYWGFHTADGPSRTTNVLYDNLDLQVGADSELTYKIFPNLDELELAWPSTYVAVDLEYTEAGDNTPQRMSTAGLTDSFGFPATARGQGESKRIFARQWNSVRVHLGALEGATIHKVLLSYDNPNGFASSVTSGWVDDIRLGGARVIDDSSLTNYVDTRRGSDSTGDYTRGANFPATAMPNGFNFYTPLTEGGSNIDLYKYQGSNTSQNKPRLHGLAISHEPSRWINDRNQMQFMPSITTAAVPDASLGNRELTFDHDNEVARPDYYSVDFDNGIKAEIAPGNYGAIFRFTFPANTNNRATLFLDRVHSDAEFTLRSDNTGFDGWMYGGPEGTTRMFVHARFNRSAVAQGNAAGNRGSAKYVQFDISDPADRVIELRFATSLMSVSQAWQNYENEVALGQFSFDQVQQAAQTAWNERLSVIDIPGATDEQKISMYSSLYRLNLYPNVQHEYTGQGSKDGYQYASPVNAATGNATATETNAKINDGKMYVNNGFWDTYRSAWPLYSFLYPDLAAELIDGFVEQYRAGGWIARWSTPGYKDSMTGTSSDAAFADAYIAGALPTALAEEAYAAGLKNATALSSSNIKDDGNYSAVQVGRKALNQSIFLGYSPASLDQSVSWGLEGVINDFALGKMAAALAQDPDVDEAAQARYAEESVYLLGRAEQYVNLFDPTVGDPDDPNTPLGFFQGRRSDGSWLLGPGAYNLGNRHSVYNPEDWDSGVETGHHTYTETNGWNFAFHAPHDVDGLAALYGGQADLIAKLDTFFTTQERAETRRIHETYEARDVRMGQWGASNQISFHIPWIYVDAGKPSRAQRITRDAVQRLYVGSDIGQGYLGDEDNGAMSAWYVFASLGLYPLALGSGEYVIGSPLHDQAVVKPLGRDGTLTIATTDNSVDNVYVQSASLDGQPLERAALRYDEIFDGTDHSVDFTMGDSPSTWGERQIAAEHPTAPIDLLDDQYALVTATDGDSVNVAALVDNNSHTETEFSGTTATITAQSKVGAVRVHEYTVTNAAGATGADPRSWRLEGSNNGTDWVVVDERVDEDFWWRTQTRAFQIASPGEFDHYRLVITQSGGDGIALAEIEFLAAGDDAATGELTLSSVAGLSVRAGQMFAEQIASVSGGTGGIPDVTVDYGSGPVTADVSANPFGGYVVAAYHAFDTPGVYDVTIAATQGDVTVRTTASVNVYVDNRSFVALADAANVNCFSVLGIGGSCDGEGFAYNKAKVNAAGVQFGVQQIVELAGRTFRYTLPDVPVDKPDTLTGRGQTIPVLADMGSEHITFLGMANQGPKTLPTWLVYDDGTEQQTDVTFGDWVDRANNPISGNTQVFVAPGRLQGTGEEPGNRPIAVFATDPVPLKSNARLTAIRLADQGDNIAAGKVHIVAFGFDGSATPALEVVTAGAGSVTAEAGKSFTTDLASVVGGRGTYSASVNWGDGSGVQPATIVNGAVRGTHTYTTDGSFPVKVTVTDGELSQTVSLTVTVSESDDTDPGPTDPTDPDPVDPGPVDPDRPVVRVSAPVVSKGKQVFGAKPKQRVTITASVSGVTSGVVTFRSVKTGGVVGTAPITKSGSTYQAVLRVKAKLAVGKYGRITA